MAKGAMGSRGIENTPSTVCWSKLVASLQCISDTDHLQLETYWDTSREIPEENCHDLD